MKVQALPFLVLLFLNSCSKEQVPLEVEPERSYQMGFTSWSYGPNLEDVNATYAFLETNGDIYAEHIDNTIPWNAWMNDEALPTAFTNEITGRVNRRMSGHSLLLSVSALNLGRDDLALDVDGTIPAYTHLDDESIRNAYFKHINYLVDAFAPDYLVISIESNELRLKSPEKWDGFTALISDVKSRIEVLYPNLKIAESISVHNIYEPDVADPASYIADVFKQINQHDFAAISFYPFLKNLSTASEFQAVFDFIHANTTLPIAFAETAHIAENLVIPNLNVSIDGDPSNQNSYLETLLQNAEQQDYAFIVWWAHRDFDALWETFSEEVRDLGQIWRDTGLLDENGTERPAFGTWSATFRE
ncbi:MAG: hypothetical protein AAF598_06225 [Bacteroidota bacterium]